MKVRNYLAIFLVSMLLLAAASPAFAANALSLSMSDCVTIGTTTTVTLNVSGGAPKSYEFRLYRGNTLISSASACGSVKTLSIPGKLLSKTGEYKLRVKYINANGSSAIEDACFTVQSSACATATQKPSVTARPTSKPTQAPTAKPTASPTVKPTQTTGSGGTSSASMADELVRQVNEERAKNGLSALTADSNLTSAACVRAAEIVVSFSHTRPDGSSWSTVSSKAKGENIAKGQQTVDKVMASWMSSDGHRANILRSTYKTIGVCAYQKNGIMYWVQLFGN